MGGGPGVVGTSILASAILGPALVCQRAVPLNVRFRPRHLQGVLQVVFSSFIWFPCVDFLANLIVLSNPHNRKKQQL